MSFRRLYSTIVPFYRPFSIAVFVWAIDRWPTANTIVHQPSPIWTDRWRISLDFLCSDRNRKRRREKIDRIKFVHVSYRAVFCLGVCVSLSVSVCEWEIWEMDEWMHWLHLLLARKKKWFIYDWNMCTPSMFWHDFRWFEMLAARKLIYHCDLCRHCSHIWSEHYFFFGLSPLPLYVYYIQCTQINCIFSYCYFEENTKKMIRKLIVYCLSTLGYFHPAFLYIYFLFNPWFVSYLFPILNAEQKQLTC